MQGERSFFSKIAAGLEITFDDFHENRNQGIVAPWAVRGKDIFLLSHFFKINDCAEVLDIGCGYGFISWLIAMEGIPVVGIDISEEVLDSPYNYSLLTLKQEDINNLTNNKSDGVIVSWPNQGFNPADAILNLNPRAVVYIIETMGLTGDRDGRYILDLLKNYKPILFWDNINYRDITSSLYRDAIGVSSASMIPPVFKNSHNRVILFLRKDIEEDKMKNEMLKIAKIKAKRYPWEEDLDRFCMIGDRIGEGKILWEIRTVPDEFDFIKELSYNGIIERGLIL